MKRKSFREAECPVARALDAIGDWWSLLIVRDAFDGLRRFSEIQQNLGIAKGMLASRLQEFVKLGILELVPASDGSAYKEYVLTEKGRGLFLVIVALRQWGEAHLYREGEQRSWLIDVERRRPVARLQLRAFDGRSLDWPDTLVSKTI
ncbi:helix-turn-helix HxlR type protein [Nitratireductor aquibiodomus RA22]|uniref:Helix-turn-helix HxlR type protein n=1 Tax=Nitratireductor aquibiodomus RA22 TaxID=1189611 RepID=I5BVJ1_9HYPH|nr:helix-turn-helix domain-containing protein [Nitratireductor aquibiodomus]EIM73593.1 helix-turn-helix HxlR type protein [Nitratireductor aquibiodomus RA22]